MKTQLVRTQTTVMRPEGFWVLECPGTLVLDWDLAESLEAALAATNEAMANGADSGHCTITDRSEVRALLEGARYQETTDIEVWALYHTHSGVRALRLDRAFSTTDDQLNGTVCRLSPDQGYIKQSLLRQCWAARVSHKWLEDGTKRPETITFEGYVGKGKPASAQMQVLYQHHLLLLEHGLTDEPLPLWERQVAQVPSEPMFLEF